MKVNKIQMKFFINIDFKEKEIWFCNGFLFSHVPSIGEQLNMNTWEFKVTKVISSLNSDKLNFDPDELYVELLEKIDNPHTYNRFIDDLSSFEFKKIP